MTYFYSILNLVFISFLLLNSMALKSQNAGDLDISFNQTGKIRFDFNGLDDDARAVAIQPDGKILVAGITNDSLNTSFGIARYLPDGTLDTSFDTDGYASINIGGNRQGCTEILLQPDGKIILVGLNDDGVTTGVEIVRCNANGSLDATFGTNGAVISNFPNAKMYAMAAALQSDGKIVVACFQVIGFSADIAVVRYTSSGVLDTTFDTDGLVSLNYSMMDRPTDIIIQPDQKIVVGCEYVDGNSNGNFLLVRFNTNGTLDPSFDNDGIVDSAFPNNSGCLGIAIQADGKIVAVGHGSNDPQYSAVAVARYTTNGSLDTTFNHNGLLVHSIGLRSSQAESVLIQPDGKIVVGGTSDVGTTADTDWDFALLRLTSAGSIDNTFSSDGMQTTSFGIGEDNIKKMALQADGKIVAIGFSTDSLFVKDFAIARYLSGLNVGVQVAENTISSVLLYPNPIINSFQLGYTLQVGDKMNINLFDLQGQLVGTLLKNEYRSAGIHLDSFIFPKSLGRGAYFVGISTADGMETKFIFVHY
jgi:uncharacterized delta-60 repeat protein